MTLDPRIEAAADALRGEFHGAWGAALSTRERYRRMASLAVQSYLSALSDDELVGNTGQVVKAEAVDSNTHLFVPDPAEPGYCERCGWGVDSTNHTVFRLVRLVPVGGEEE